MSSAAEAATRSGDTDALRTEPDALRAVFADQPAPVAVVLWSGPSGEDLKVGTHQAGGMTVTSVNAASLDPPLLLFCVDRRSSRIDALRRARLVSVNLLAADQAEVAARFARRGDPGGWDEHTVAGGIDDPYLPTARWSLRGHLQTSHGIGASDLFVVQVERVRAGSGTDPLVYHRRSYGSVVPR